MLVILTSFQSLKFRVLGFVVNHFAPVMWPPHSFSNMPSILSLQGLCICVLFSWKVPSLGDLQSLPGSSLLVSSNTPVKCCLDSPSQKKALPSSLPFLLAFIFSIVNVICVIIIFLFHQIIMEIEYRDFVTSVYCFIPCIWYNEFLVNIFLNE